MTWSRTLSTGGRPIDARLVLSASPNSALMLWASRSHSTRLSVTSGGNGRPGYASGGRCGDGRVSGWKVTDTERMPSFSATDSAPAAAGIMPVATIASHPSAAAGTASNWPAINSAARRGRADADGAAVVSARADGPTGTSGTPTPASRSAKSSSGGAHTRTSAPSSRNCTASPTSGSTSPRDPYVDNNTRTSRLPFPQVLALGR